MKFSVIYSVDTPAEVDVLDYAPPQVGDLWDDSVRGHRQEDICRFDVAVGEAGVVCAAEASEDPECNGVDLSLGQRKVGDH